MKKLTAITVMLLVLLISAAAYAAGTTYTFKGNKVITDGSPNDITNVELTKDITVTTSGNMNRKYVGITDLKHNNEVGTFPANDKFKATGSYLYMATANANDGAVITLQIPEIKKGSKVTLTFAKPTVTNNGSTLRNTNDPYAYLKIADRYISINGDNFDTWRTESVVTGEDTSEIVFYADKWGAVAISKIEITEGDTTPLHSVNIASTQYANLNVNGIKFCADENGKITLPSYEKGSEISITAYKDGYETKEMTQTVVDKDIDISIPLDTTVDAAYYESDFGNADGTLALDGEYKFGDGINAEEVTKVFARAEFEKDGYLDINTDSNIAAHLVYNGEYIGITDVGTRSYDDFIYKNNLEFELYYDRKNGAVWIRQVDENEYDRYWYLNNASDAVNYGGEDHVTISKINSISGKGVKLEYIGVSYPDTSKITIEGPDVIASPIQEDSSYVCVYNSYPEYWMPERGVSFSCESEYGNIETHTRGRSLYPIFVTGGNFKPAQNGEGVATITAEFNGATASKTVKIVKPSKITDYMDKGQTRYVNLYSSYSSVWLDEVKDESGAKLEQYAHYIMKDYKSSDENVLRVNSEGELTPVGKGSAKITFNAYTGQDNIITVDYVVDNFFIEDMAEAPTTYVENDFDNKYITGYKLSWQNGKEDIQPTQIPAYTIKEDGTVVTTNFDMEKRLRSVKSKKVKKGDKVLPTNEARKVYFCKAGSIELIETSDTTVEGFAFSSVPKGDYYEISPVYTYTDLGDVKDGVTLDGVFPFGPYDFTFKKGEAKRGDIFVNGFMAGNNVDQCDADRKLTEGSEYTVEQFATADYWNGETNDKITISMTDGSTLLDSVSVSRSGNYYEPTIYIIGDSLVCNYYGDFEKEVGGGRTGWGQVLGNYINANIVNLANSGQFAKGLYDTAFPSVVNNNPSYALIECGYNDRSYSTRDEMIQTVKKMVTECREKGIKPILITPNASAHDYKPSVSWSSYLKDAAIDMNCPLIDLSQLSYDFLYSLYGDDEDKNITKTYNLTEVGGDTLHSSYAAAQKWASVVAQAMKDTGIEQGAENFYNTDYTYTFTDTLGNKIDCRVE